MLATIQGEFVDRIPWAPRMDLWFIANRARGTLPEKFVGLNLVEIAEVLGVGCHAVGGDHTLPGESDLVLRGLGCDNHLDYPYRVELQRFPVVFEDDGENARTRITTPAGEVFTHLFRSSQMIKDGISLPFFKSHAIQSVDDFEPVAQIFENLEVIATPQGYSSFRKRVGESGLAVARGPIAASPMHLLLHQLIPYDQFFYLYMDQRKALRQLAAQLEPFFESILEILVSCDSDVVFWGANYDQNITWPTFFETEISPWLKKVSDRLHTVGKYHLTHTDGENRALLPLYPGCGFDIAESVCPYPMTQCTLAEIMEGMGPGVTIWGGIPSVILLDSSTPDQVFEEFLDDLFSTPGIGNRLILGVSDNVPPDANLTRLDEIKKRVEAFDLGKHAN
jgi:hypothetical protein